MNPFQNEDDDDEYLPDQIDIAEAARQAREAGYRGGNPHRSSLDLDEGQKRNIEMLMTLYPLPWQLAINEDGTMIGMVSALGQMVPMTLSAKYPTLALALLSGVNSFRVFERIGEIVREGLDEMNPDDADHIRRATAAYSDIYRESGLLPLSRGTTEFIEPFLVAHPEHRAVFEDLPDAPQGSLDVFSDVLDTISHSARKDENR